MPKFLIERTVPGASRLSREQLAEIAAKSCDVVRTLPNHGRDYTWHETFVAGDKMYCVHSAPDEATVREHSRRAGFPVDRVTEVPHTFGPQNAAEARVRATV